MPSALPTKGPVNIENRMKRTIGINFVVGHEPVTREGSIAKEQSIVERIILGSSLDRDAARDWRLQNEENEKQRKRDPSIPEIDPRSKVHSPDVYITAEQWRQIMATEPAKNHLAALQRRREILVTQG